MISAMDIEQIPKDDPRIKHIRFFIAEQYSMRNSDRCYNLICPWDVLYYFYKLLRRLPEDNLEKNELEARIVNSCIDNIINITSSLVRQAVDYIPPKRRQQDISRLIKKAHRAISMSSSKEGYSLLHVSCDNKSVYRVYIMKALLANSRLSNSLKVITSFFMGDHEQEAEIVYRIGDRLGKRIYILISPENDLEGIFDISLLRYIGDTKC